jgi:hypothetical protein
MVLTTDDTDKHRWLTHWILLGDEAMNTNGHESAFPSAEASDLSIRVNLCPLSRRSTPRVSLRSVVVKKFLLHY